MGSLFNGHNKEYVDILGKAAAKMNLELEGKIGTIDLRNKRKKEFQNIQYVIVTNVQKSPGWCGSVVWSVSSPPKGLGFNSQSRPMPRLWVGGNQSMFFIFYLSKKDQLKKKVFR